MKVLLSWLREFAPTDLSAEDLAEFLTAKGAEVESVERPWAGLEGVVVARVLEVRDHPDADKLCVARVDAGAGEVQVVVGVRNMKSGDLVPYAPPGARVPVRPEPLEHRDVRGVTSNGMLCSPWELAISPDHHGILVLPPDTPVGVDLKVQLGLDDAVLDVEVTPNRPDLMSVVGVAREVAAATGVPLTLPDTSVVEGDEKATDVATVEIRDLERCPRYLARVIRGVSVGPSPLNVQARLTASGMRPLSNVVDATNYVLLEMGHPLHPFDLAALEGSGIVVRRAEEGERIVTLDDVERTLTADDLVIADHATAVAIAGVMGSAPVEVSATTRDVLLESAYFERTGIARTSQRLGLRTEASARFQRGADPEAVPRAADRSAALIAAWSRGTVLAGSIDVGAAPERRRIRVRPERASLLLGMEVSATQVVDSLGKVGIATEERSGAIEAEVPGFRPDIEQEVDLIEEVIRVLGYERLGETLPAIRQAGGVPPVNRFRRRIREALARAGLLETTSYSFASAADLALVDDREGVRVANPLAADDEFLRTSLLPGLLRALSGNLAHQVLSGALFEVGRVFYPGDGDSEHPVEEHERVAWALAGQASRGYPDPPREFDFSDAKGALETLLEALGIRDWSLGPPPNRHLFHPTRSASVVVGDRLAGQVGELHPNVTRRLDFPGRVAVAELEVAVLAVHAWADLAYREVPRFPPVRRDLAFTVDASTPGGALRDAIVEAAGGLAGSVTLFDVHTGPPIAEGKKSLAFSVDFRAPDRTLTDQEAEQTVQAIVDRLAKDFGAELRSG
ncbi:MAG: phenylalanine--tRNA ligase subunit beta [Actinomycetota bacterium]|nr:phenylalanine--tRNA ligase subunit beta [Actinomycetota bacterium]